VSVRVGVISDTHGLLRPEALRALAGSDFIVHAGDIGAPGILDALACIAPVTAVRGNNDLAAAWARALGDTALLRAGGVAIHVLHDVHALTADPGEEGHGVVVAGHSHRPLVQRRGPVLYVNPGSAGPRRFTLPVSVAHIDIVEGIASARIIVLADVAPARRVSRGARAGYA
jgi:putative phosphoesterase